MRRSLIISVMLSAMFFAIGRINAQTITLNSNNQTNYCAGSNVSIGFSTTINSPMAYLFMLELSDSNGSFSNYYSVSWISPASSTASITGLLPGNIGGTGYKLRIQTDFNVKTSDTLSLNITPVHVTVTRSHTSSNPCNDTFSLAAHTDVSLAPSYQWQLNGFNILGATDSVYTTYTYNSGDYINCAITTTSTGICAGTNHISNSTQLLKSTSKSYIDLYANPYMACRGTPITFTAVPFNGGITPTYQWLKNSVPIPGITGNIYTSNNLNDGDSISCILYSSNTCTTYAPLWAYQQGYTPNAGIIRVNIMPGLQDSVSISTPTTSVCFDSSVTFNTVVKNGGTAPTYQWVRNSNLIFGATSSSYTTNVLATGDVVYCIMTGNGACPATTYSNLDTMAVSTALQSYVHFTLSPTGGLCPGSTITCTATPVNGGTSPTYQWAKNMTIIPGATGSSYTSTYYRTDTLNCFMISSRACTTPLHVGWDTYAITGIQASVAMPIYMAFDTIGIVSHTICAGNADTLTAIYSNSNAYLHPMITFQWLKNGINIPGATNYQYVLATPVTGDTIACIMTNTTPNNNCVYPYRSKNFIVAIGLPVTPVISIAASADSICAGVPVTFYAHTVNGGSIPGFTWLKNNVNLPAGTDSIYTTTTLSNNDTISCVLTSNAQCALSSIGISNNIPITVNPMATPAVTIIANPGTNISAGTPVTFIATPTNGGTAPVYQWTLNSVAISGANTSTYTTSALSNGDNIGVLLTSNAPCASPATISANPLSIRVSTGIQTVNDAFSKINIYPDPSQGTFTIQGTMGEHKAHEIKASLLNLLGQTVLSNQIPVVNDIFTHQISLPTNTPNGIYILRLEIDGEHLSSKVTIGK